MFPSCPFFLQYFCSVKEEKRPQSSSLAGTMISEEKILSQFKPGFSRQCFWSSLDLGLSAAPQQLFLRRLGAELSLCNSKNCSRIKIISELLSNLFFTCWDSPAQPPGLSDKAEPPQSTRMGLSHRDLEHPQHRLPGLGWAQGSFGCFSLNIFWGNC